MKNILHILLLLSLMVFVMSCEEEYIPVKTSEGQKFVVEGYIETGENTLPPYLILTRTLDFYSEIGPEQFSNTFVHGADVRVSDGSKEVLFEEVCFLDLPPEIRQQVAAQFGYNSDSLQINFCVYIDLLRLLDPQENKKI